MSPGPVGEEIEWLWQWVQSFWVNDVTNDDGVDKMMHLYVTLLNWTFTGRYWTEHLQALSWHLLCNVYFAKFKIQNSMCVEIFNSPLLETSSSAVCGRAFPNPIPIWLLIRPSLCRPSAEICTCYEFMIAMVFPRDDILQLIFFSSGCCIFLPPLLKCFLILKEGGIYDWFQAEHSHVT